MITENEHSVLREKSTSNLISSRAREEKQPRRRRKEKNKGGSFRGDAMEDWYMLSAFFIDSPVSLTAGVIGGLGSIRLGPSRAAAGARNPVRIGGCREGTVQKI